jgi:hypothetical protein
MEVTMEQVFNALLNLSIIIVGTISFVLIIWRMRNKKRQSARQEVFILFLLLVFNGLQGKVILVLLLSIPILWLVILEIQYSKD